MSYDAWQDYKAIKKPTIQDLEAVVKDLSIMVQTSMKLAVKSLKKGKSREINKKQTTAKQRSKQRRRR